MDPFVKQPLLVSGTNIKTINGSSVMGSGDLTVSGGSGNVATDNIWDAAGDLVQGTGNNTAARLAIGAALSVLQVNSGATAVEYVATSGTGSVARVDSPTFTTQITTGVIKFGSLKPVISTSGTQLQLRNSTDTDYATWTFKDLNLTGAATVVGAIGAGGAVTGSNLSGTNTGDNATNSQYSGLVTNATHTGDATGATALTLATVNSNVGSFGSATQSSVITVNAKGLVTAASVSTVTPAVGSITGFGTGVGTALAIAVGTSGGPVTNGGSLGTPASGVLTNCTGTASGLTAGNVTTNANLTGHVTSTGNAAVLGSFTSAQLAAALTDETGSGANVHATSPTLVTPTLGVGTYTMLKQASTEPSTTPSGTTATLDLNSGNKQTINLGSASGNVTLTLTIPTGTTSASGRILAIQGATSRNLTIAASDASTIKYFDTKQDTSTDSASTARAYNWDWNGTNIYVGQTAATTT